MCCNNVTNVHAQRVSKCIESSRNECIWLCKSRFLLVQVHSLADCCSWVRGGKSKVQNWAHKMNCPKIVCDWRIGVLKPTWKVVMLCAQVMTPLVFVCKVLLCPFGIHGSGTIFGSSLGNMFSICSFACHSLVSVTCHMRLCTSLHTTQHQTMTLNTLGTTCGVESKICIGSLGHGLCEHLSHNLNWGMRLLFMHELLLLHHNLILDNSPGLIGKTHGIKHGIGHCKVFIETGVTVELHCKEHIIIGSVTRIGCISCCVPCCTFTQFGTFIPKIKDVLS